MKVMQHPFIVNLKYSFQTQKNLYLVMDYCPGGDLNKMIEDSYPIPEEYIKIYACEIILALEALHNNCIIF